MNSRAPSRRAITRAELIVVLFALAFIVLILALTTWKRAQFLSLRAVCASNLRGLGQGLQIYSTQNGGYLPNFRFEITGNEDGDFRRARFEYAGLMGSTERLSIRESDETAAERDIATTSRAIFALMIAGTNTVGQAPCISNVDFEDDLRNYGRDRVVTTSESEVARPGQNRFDFRGYGSLGYGMQLSFRSRPNQGRTPSSRMVILADKGPYFEAGPEFADTHSRPDRRSSILPPAALGTTTASLLAKSPDAWRPWNSRNHEGEGQNVLFLDGHAEFVTWPLVGPDHDNIYTAATRSDPTGGLIGKVTEPGTETARIAPLTETDAYIVP